MSDEQSLGTEVCVICGGPVEWYSGHVLDPETKQSVAAGLCLVHGATREAGPCLNAFGRQGCYGYLLPEHGLVELELP